MRDVGAGRLGRPRPMRLFSVRSERSDVTRLGIAVSYPLTSREFVMLAQESERRGLHSFWLTEGFGKDAFAQAAAIATQTERIVLGTAVVNMFIRTAALTAMGAASLDDISEGRFVLGVGTGHKPVTEQRHGVPFRRPLQHIREYMTIIRRSLTGEQVDFPGEIHDLTALRLHFPAKRTVPLYMAVLGPRIARMAGEIADGVILHMATEDHVGRVREAIAEGAAAVGRDPAEVEVACFINCRAADDEEKAKSDIADAILFYGRLHFYREEMRASGLKEEADAFEEAWAHNDAEAARASITERLWQTLPVAAGPDEISKRVDDYRRAGVDLPIMYATTDWHGSFESVMDVLRAAPIG